jgi:hypothetical protein
MKTLKACGALLFISIAIAAFPNRIVLSLVVCSVDIFTDSIVNSKLRLT